MTGRLHGQVILNTRPAHQQGELTEMLEADGATVLSFPAIAIDGVDAPQRQALAATIADYDILLFVSRNAVDGAAHALDPATLSADTTFGVIGSATRAALAEVLGDAFDLEQCLVAGEPYSSETLLESPALAEVAGKRILILRGQAGRNLLGDELARRGARVDYAEVYRRVLPAVDTAAFNRLVAPAFPTLVLFTSGEGMHNLFALIDAAAADRQRRVPWLLISERMRESAQKLGHNASLLIARNASDSGIRQTVSEWANRQ